MQWLLYTLLSAIIWAFVPILVKLSTVRIDPVVITTIRSTFVALFLIMFCMLTKKCAGMAYCNSTRIDWIYLMAASVLSGISWILYFTAFKYGPVSKIAAIERISFVLTIILSSLLLKEQISMQMMVGIGLMLAGMFMIAT